MIQALQCDENELASKPGERSINQQQPAIFEPLIMLLLNKCAFV